jgi:hypothetical protein
VLYGGLICVQLAEEAVLKTGTRGINADQGRTKALGETLPDMWETDLL